MENKRVSILIPCYNHSKYVEQAMNSVLNDTYPDKEIVIIDDGSNDNSVEVINNWIKEYKNTIRIIFKFRENKGINATLNELKSLATGQYLSILASDDYLLPNSINKRMKLLIENPNKMVVFGDAQVVNESSEVIAESSISDFHHGNKNLLRTDKGILNAALFSPCFSGPIALMNKNVFDIIGSYPEDLLVEDWFYWQRVAIKNLAIFIDDYVCCYRRHDLNITNGKQSIKILESIIKTCRINFSLLKFSFVKIKFGFFITKIYLSYIKHKFIK